LLRIQTHRVSLAIQINLDAWLILPGSIKFTRQGMRGLAARSLSMRDIALLLATVGFFVLSIAYVRFCDRVK
jgi:hypothetical protein